MPRKGRVPTPAQRRQMDAWGLRNVSELEHVLQAVEGGIDFEREPFTPAEYCWSIRLYAPKRKMLIARTGNPAPTLAEVKAFQPDIEDLRRYHTERKSRNTARASLLLGPTHISKKKAETRDSVLKRYLEKFEPQTPNDLANLQVLIDYQMKRAQFTSRLVDFPIDKGFDPKALESLMKAVADLNSQCLKLEQTLGIDRQTRDKKASQEKDPERWEKILIAAREFWETRIVRVRHCGLELGWVTWTFDELGASLHYTCPRCNKEASEWIYRPRPATPILPMEDEETETGETAP
jgi:hypothetical protein